jgi:hypothetical protein
MKEFKYICHENDICLVLFVFSFSQLDIEKVYSMRMMSSSMTVSIWIRVASVGGWHLNLKGLNE